MKYQWKDVDGNPVSSEQLAEFVLRHAHEFYSAASAFSVTEDDGYTGLGGEESVYREDAFHTAAEHYGVPYATFYDAWVSETPIPSSGVSGTVGASNHGGNMDNLIEKLGDYTESVDMLLKAIADDDRNAFVAAISVVGMRRIALDTTTAEFMGATA